MTESDFGEKVELTDQQVKDWMEKIRNPRSDEDRFYEEQIHKAVEAGDETALEFVRRANEINPLFTTSHFPYLEEDKLKRKKR